MRQVKKETIDRLLEAVDEYGKSFDTGRKNGEKYKRVLDLTKIASKQIHGNASYGTFNYSFYDFICSLRIIHPIKYCTNEEIYAILKMLDIEVIEEEQTNA